MKRAGSSLDSSFTDEHPVVGSKRPVRERLGINVDSSAEVNNKRFISFVPSSFMIMVHCSISKIGYHSFLGAGYA